jgi:hypothetical protein
MRLLEMFLDIYAKLSGLRVNLNKSELLVTMAEEHEVQQLAQILECRASTFPIKYLGLPLSNKKLTKEHYRCLIQKIRNRFPGWKAPLLSPGGRLTLVNSTLTFMPILFHYIN